MSSFWKNKKVFLTGHTGFKGSWMSLWLYNLGAEVYGYSLEPNTKENLFEILNIKNKIKNSDIGNIRDIKTLKNSLNKAQPDIVIHMAAQPLVRLSYEEPIDTLNTNIIGTANLLENLRYVKSIRASVIVTSDKCYDNKERLHGYVESEPMGGYDPYSVSKGCAELVTASYRRSFFADSDYINHQNAIATARAGNVIGGGDWSQDRLIPDAIKCFENNKTLSVRSPNAIRPWQHVLEPLAGYLQLAEALYRKNIAFTSGWNFGPETSDILSVKDVVYLLEASWPNNINWKIESLNQVHEANLLALNCEKAKSKLSWKPIWNVKKAIENTVDWHLAYRSKQDMIKLSSAQINQYILDAGYMNNGECK
jgi:CDP-glucose 4,6-dehydratase